MTTLQQIGREIRYRKTNFTLGLTAILLATALFVAFFSAGEASQRETTRLMRDMGFNLRIIPRETDMERFWITGFSQLSMPEHYVQDLADHPGISYNHLTATLQKTITWEDHEVILTGMAPEVIPPGKTSSLMTFSIEPGTVYVGFEPAGNLGLSPGDIIEIENLPFTVAQCLPETGSRDDIRIYGLLRDVQNILDLPGRINEIRALQCMCGGDYNHMDSLDQLRAQLKDVLPGAKVMLMQSIATARQEQRIMVERYFSYVFPLLLFAVMAWIGILAFLNVRERRHEIGIMRAIGHGSGKIALLFLGKAAVMGFSGAAVGFLLGTALSVKFGPQVFKITASSIRPQMELLIWSLLGSPLVCAAAVIIPTMLGVYQDPAVTLKEE
jgi:ABC-type lipoprotein release transport system permease subunit